MIISMLWFDANPATSLMDKIVKAAEYYKKKYGRSAELCLVNPSAFTDQKLDDESMPTGLTVRPWRSVLPGHFLLGVEDEPEYAKKIREEMEVAREANL